MKSSFGEATFPVESTENSISSPISRLALATAKNLNDVLAGSPSCAGSGLPGFVLIMLNICNSQGGAHSSRLPDFR